MKEIFCKNKKYFFYRRNFFQKFGILLLWKKFEQAFELPLFIVHISTKFRVMDTFVSLLQVPE